MKSCLEFVGTKLTSFIVTIGVFNIIDVLRQFQVVTNVVTLDSSYLKTEDVTKMRYGATRSEQGYLNLKAQSDLVKMLLNIITNPGSPEDAVRINTALKTLCKKLYDDTGKFYDLIHEGMHQRMLFQKLSQIYGPLIEEIKVNKEFLIMLINNKLMTMEHLEELSRDGCDGNTEAMRIGHYIIHNVNHHHRLKNFLYIVQGWVRDRNLIEDLEEIVFDIEMVQCNKLDDKIREDFVKTLCEIY